jgi:hypothetical protein
MAARSQLETLPLLNNGAVDRQRLFFYPVEDRPLLPSWLPAAEPQAARVSEDLNPVFQIQNHGRRQWRLFYVLMSLLFSTRTD